MGVKKIGLQMYSIRGIYSQNPDEAFKLIKDSGYDAVDMFGKIKMSAREMKNLLDKNGLECCGWHMPWDYTRPDILEAFAEYNKVIGNKYVIMPNLLGEFMKDRDSWIRGSQKLSEMAAQLKPHGMYTGMHSHASEFKPLDSGEYPWDVIAQNTVKDVVLQLDLGNTLDAGVDPVAVLKKYTGRYQTIHIKPYSKSNGFSAVIGEDNIDWQEVVDFCNTSGDTEFLIIEVEVADSFEIIKKCALNLRKFL